MILNPWLKLIQMFISIHAVLTDYEEFYKVVKNSKSDGIVLHLNRSCKLMGLLNNEGAEYVNAKLGVPYVSFDGDQTDPRVFTPAQYETRVQALTEMMDENQ